MTYSLGFHSKVLSMADVNASVVCATAKNGIRVESRRLDASTHQFGFPATGAWTSDAPLEHLESTQMWC